MNTSPKVWAGFLREIHVSITGIRDDYAVEVASGAWFGSLVWPGAVGPLVGGPVGLAAGVDVGGIMVYEFEKHVWEPLPFPAHKSLWMDLNIKKLFASFLFDSPNPNKRT